MLRLVLKRYLRGTSQLVSVTVLVAIFIGLIAAISLAISRTEAASVAKSLSNSNLAESGVSATFSGNFSTENQSELDAYVRKALTGVGVDEPAFFVTYRPIVNSTGQIFHLVGISADHIKVQSGQVPLTCDESNCQVAIVSGEAVDLPQGFTKVGNAGLDTSAVSDLTLQAGIPVYVTSDVSGILSQPLVAQMPRTVVWAAPISSSYLQNIGPRAALKDLRKIANEFSVKSARLELQYPEVAITNAVIQSSEATKRLSRLLLEVGLLCLLGIAVLGKVARPKNFAAARVLQQIRGKNPWLMPWLAAFISLVPALVVSALIYFFVGLPAVPVAVFLSSAFLILAITLAFGAMWAYGILGLTVICVSLTQRDPGFAGILVLIIVLFGLSRVGRNFWKSPIQLATFRSAELRAICLLIGITSVAVTGWVVTASSLDNQEQHRIAYLTPLETTISGLQSGVLQDVTISEYSSYGHTVPVETLSATTSGIGALLENVQVVGIPNDAGLTELPEIGGPSVDQLKLLTDVKTTPELTGTGFPLRVINVPARMELWVWVLDENNQSLSVPISQAITKGMKILGVEVLETSKDQERREHASGEGSHSIELPAGTVQFELPNGMVVTKDVILNEGSVYIPVIESTKKLKAVVSPNLGEIGDSIVVNLAKDLSAELEVVANSERFPTIPGNFAVIDQQSLNDYLAQSSPELIRTSQIWLEGQIPAGDPRFNKLNVISRSSLDEEFASDPVRSKIQQMYFALLAMLIIGVFAVSALVTVISHRNANIYEWVGRGENRSQLIRAISRVILIGICVSVVAGVAVGILAASSLLSGESLTWAGLVAMPPVELSFSVTAISELILALLGSAWAGIALGGVRRGN